MIITLEMALMLIFLALGLVALGTWVGDGGIIFIAAVVFLLLGVGVLEGGIQQKVGEIEESINSDTVEVDYKYENLGLSGEFLGLLVLLISFPIFVMSLNKFTGG